MTTVTIQGFATDTGPVHAFVPNGLGQAYCGTRPQIRHRYRVLTGPGEVTCSTCARAMAEGRPRARRGKR